MIRHLFVSILSRWFQSCCFKMWHPYEFVLIYGFVLIRAVTRNLLLRGVLDTTEGHSLLNKDFKNLNYIYI